jgi:hypothetical protein
MPLVRFWSPEVLAESAGLVRFLKPGKSRCPAHNQTVGFHEPARTDSVLPRNLEELKKWRSRDSRQRCVELCQIDAMLDGFESATIWADLRVTQLYKEYTFRIMMHNTHSNFSYA